MKRARQAFSLTELLVCLVAVAMVFLFAFVGVRQLKPRTALISCESRLKEIGLAFRSFAADHEQNFPMALGADQGGSSLIGEDGNAPFKHYQTLAGILAMPERLVCPQDERLSAKGWGQLTATNVSYFLGLNAKPSVPTSILAGDRNITTNAPRIVTSASGLQWQKSVGLHGDVGNVLFTDGHVERLTSVGLSNALQHAGNLTNRFAVP